MIINVARGFPWALGGCALGLLGCLSASPPDAAERRTVSETAVTRPIPPGAPRRSDVCFSTRWLREAPDDPHRDSFASARAFHATRLDWVYEQGNAEFVARAKAEGYAFSGALSSLMSDEPGGTSQTLGRSLNLAGERVHTMWLETWRMAWACPNHPDYREVWLRHARLSIEAGVDSLQMDGAQMDYTTRHGGCFCPVCIAGFREYLSRHIPEAERVEMGVEPLAAFDYAAYLRAEGTEPNQGIRRWKGDERLRDHYAAFLAESSADFYRDVHARLNAFAGRRVPHSCNAAADFFDSLHEFHDFPMAESYPYRQGRPDRLYRDFVAPSLEMGKPFVFTHVSDDVPHTRRFISLVYALGGHVIVPWDVYTGPRTPRVFATPDQYADLYGFVRACAGYLDGYEEAAIAGPDWVEERYGARPPLRIRGGRRVYGVLRARPGEPDAPVVAHLVDGSDAPRPFTLALDSMRLFGDRPLKLTLLTPPPYEAATHEQAASGGDYTALARRRELPGGRVGTIDIPALTPWGLLVIEPDDEVETAGVWQPMIWTEDADHYGPELRVFMRSATEGAEIRYTTDGSEPTRRSALYGGPVLLRESATVRARAFAAGAASAPARVAYAMNPDTERLLPPDAEGLADSLRLWLRADALSGRAQDGSAVDRWPASAGPDLATPRVDLLSGAPAAPPTFRASALNGQPAIEFDGVDDLLAAEGFANEHLAGSAFTVMMVTLSDDRFFGLSGNSLNASGGAPRLYATRHSLIYGELRNLAVANAPDGEIAISTFDYDGANTGRAFVNGNLAGAHSSLERVGEFGEGGSLAIPFWSGQENRAGLAGEIIIYARRLEAGEREGVERYLARKYGIAAGRVWE